MPVAPTQALRVDALAQRQAEFNARCADCLREQNDSFEKHGLWCEGLVTWMAHDEE